MCIKPQKFISSILAILNDSFPFLRWWDGNRKLKLNRNGIREKKNCNTHRAIIVWLSISQIILNNEEISDFYFEIVRSFKMQFAFLIVFPFQAHVSFVRLYNQAKRSSWTVEFAFLFSQTCPKPDPSMNQSTTWTCDAKLVTVLIHFTMKVSRAVQFMDLP